MKAKLLCYALVIISLVECSSFNKSISSDNSHLSTMDRAKLSNSFNSFWEELTEEANGKSLEQYIPSQALIERYSLKKQDQQILVSGFLHTDSTFNKADIECIGGNVVTYANKIKTFSVPIKNVSLLIQVKGITYIEIGRKVRTKNSPL